MRGLTGAWRIAHLLVLPCLALTVLFGPIGFLAFTTLRALSPRPTGAP